MNRFLGDATTLLVHDLRAWYSCRLATIPTDEQLYFEQVGHAETSGFSPCPMCLAWAYESSTPPMRPGEPNAIDRFAAKDEWDPPEEIPRIRR